MHVDAKLLVSSVKMVNLLFDVESLILAQLPKVGLDIVADPKHDDVYIIAIYDDQNQYSLNEVINILCNMDISHSIVHEWKVLSISGDVS